jgi:hypothetical protein
MSEPRRLRLLLWAALALLAAALPAEAADPEPSAADIVGRSDQVRNPDKPFRLTNTLVEYIDGKARDHVVLVIYAREDRTTLRFSNIARYVEPPRDFGKIALLSPPSFWFYDPASKSSIRISPQQRLIGQASDADVLTVNLGRDYKAAILGEETIQDADRKDRQCWHLELIAATEEAIYARMEYWIERSTYRSVKAKFYSDSGRLLKIAYYRKYQEQLGGVRPTETVIIDAVDSKLVTTITASDYRYQDIPDAWFQRDFLPRLKLD